MSQEDPYLQEARVSSSPRLQETGSQGFGRTPGGSWVQQFGCYTDGRNNTFILGSRPMGESGTVTHDTQQSIQGSLSRLRAQ